MGKRGPKLGSGGRPIVKDNEFAEVQRLRVSLSRATKRKDNEAIQTITDQLRKLDQNKQNQVNLLLKSKQAEIEQKDRKLSELQDSVKILSEFRNLDFFGKRNPETGSFPESKELEQAFIKLSKLTLEQRKKAQKTLKEQLQASLEQTKILVEYLKQLEKDKEKLQILEENNQALAKIIKEHSK